MSNEITVNEKAFAVKEFKGQRVVTFKDIDSVHERPDGTASRNFRQNRKYFIEGTDFFCVKSGDFQNDEIRRFGINSPRGITVLTESGYLMLVKSFTDDLAWDVQRQLVNNYFNKKPAPKKSSIPKNECKQLELYEYFDKFFNGMQVLTMKDVMNFTGLDKGSIRYTLRYAAEEVDYFTISGKDLIRFKRANPSCSRLSKSLMLFTESGFRFICDHANIKLDFPKPKEKQTPEKKAERPKLDSTQNERLIALKVLNENKQFLMSIASNAERKEAVRHSFDCCIKAIAMEISAAP